MFKLSNFQTFLIDIFKLMFLLANVQSLAPYVHALCFYCIYVCACVCVCACFLNWVYVSSSAYVCVVYIVSSCVLVLCCLLMCSLVLFVL